MENRIAITLDTFITPIWVACAPGSLTAFEDAPVVCIPLSPMSLRSRSYSE